jgi:hypothetical protein
MRSIETFSVMFREIGAYYEERSNPTTKVTKAMIICFFVATFNSFHSILLLDLLRFR